MGRLGTQGIRGGFADGYLVISANVPARIAQRLTELALANGHNRSQEIRAALAQYVERGDDEEAEVAG